MLQVSSSQSGSDQNHLVPLLACEIVAVVGSLLVVDALGGGAQLAVGIVMLVFAACEMVERMR